MIECHTFLSRQLFTKTEHEMQHRNALTCGKQVQGAEATDNFFRPQSGANRSSNGVSAC